jgi:peptide/nickel transport system substrate-binding protein
MEEKEAKTYDRREFLKIAGATGAAAVGLSAGMGEMITAATASAKSRYGGTLTVGYITQPLSLNGISCTNAQADTIIYNWLYNRPFIFDRNVRLIPDLAESWELAPDAMSFTMKLLKGVKFHDGSEFDANLFKWHYDQRVIGNAASCNKGRFGNFIESLEVLDKYTVRFNYKAPNRTGHYHFVVFIGILPGSKQAVESMGEEAFATNPVGTGPFKFQEWKQNESLTFVRNENYFKKDAEGNRYPYLDKVQFIPITDPKSRITALKAGTVDVLYTVPPMLLDQIKDDPDIQTYTAPGTDFTMFMINPVRPGLTDKRVRQAINCGFDRQAIADIAYKGTARPARGLFSPAVVGKEYEYPSGGLIYYKYDPDRARRLLDEAGVKSLQVELTYYAGVDEYENAGLLIQSQLKDIGVDVVLDAGETSKVVDKVYYTKEFDLHIVFWSGIWPDPDGSTFWAESPSYFPELPDDVQAEINRLGKAGRAETDRAKQVAIYKEFELLLADQAELNILVFNDRIDAARKNVKGYWIHGSTACYLDWVYLED